jgi:response regulator RpfG family c-di-GMP phosphodiesterase
MSVISRFNLSPGTGFNVILSNVHCDSAARLHRRAGVSTQAAMVTHNLGLSRKRATGIRFYAMFHHIGARDIPTGRLRKTDALTEKEFACRASIFGLGL